jgi:hypothetical protein
VRDAAARGAAGMGGMGSRASTGSRVAPAGLVRAGGGAAGGVTGGGVWDGVVESGEGRVGVDGEGGVWGTVLGTLQTAGKAGTQAHGAWAVSHGNGPLGVWHSQVGAAGQERSAAKSLRTTPDSVGGGGGEDFNQQRFEDHESNVMGDWAADSLPRVASPAPAPAPSPVPAHTPVLLSRASRDMRADDAHNVQRGDGGGGSHLAEGANQGGGVREVTKGGGARNVESMAEWVDTSYSVLEEAERMAASIADMAAERDDCKQACLRLRLREQQLLDLRAHDQESILSLQAKCEGEQTARLEAQARASSLEARAAGLEAASVRQVLRGVA